MSTPRIPTLESHLASLVELAQDEGGLARAVAHLATIESGPRRTDVYTTRYRDNLVNAGGLIALGLAPGSLFAEMTRDALLVTQLDAPVINQTVELHEGERLVVGHTVSLFAHGQQSRTKAGGIYVSAGDFLGAVTDTAAATEAIRAVDSRVVRAAYFAGPSALGALESFYEMPIQELMGVPPEPVPQLLVS